MVNFSDYAEYERVVNTIRDVAVTTGIDLEHVIAKLDDMFDERALKEINDREFDKHWGVGESNGNWRVGK